MNTDMNRLIARFLSGNTTEQENLQVNNWINQNAANKAEFEKAQKIWQLSLNLKKDRPADTTAAWNDLMARTQKAPKKRPVVAYYRIAAGLALVACLAVILNFIFSKTTETPSNIAVLQGPPAVPTATVEVIDTVEFTVDTVESNSVQPEKKKTVRKKKKELKNVVMITISTNDTAKALILPDNSIVFLNEHSSIMYEENFGKTNRKIALTGEAYFEVKRDTMQMVVACGNTITRGTEAAFNIKEDKKYDRVEVILASGSAEFSGVGREGYKKLILNAGERGTYQKEVLVKEKNSRKDYKWWQKKGLRAKLKSLLERIKGTFR